MLKTKSKYENMFEKANAGEDVFFKGSLEEWQKDAVPAFIVLGGRYNASREIVTIPDFGAIIYNSAE